MGSNWVKKTTRVDKNMCADAGPLHTQTFTEGMGISKGNWATEVFRLA